MKCLVLSDIHPDMWYGVADRNYRESVIEPKEEFVFNTLDWMWKFQSIPDTPAILISGDIANDYLAFTRIIKWLTQKYEQVYFTLGNHDLIVRGATLSQSNLQFKKSAEKVDAMKEYCSKFPNVHLLDGNIVNGIGGTMMTCDLKTETMPGIDYSLKWERNWFDGKHWRVDNTPTEIWNHYEAKMNNIIKQKPKVIACHFAPIEVGVSFEYRNNPNNVFFYFTGTPFFNKITQDTIWTCGHIHNRKICEYENDAGKKIKILCNPYGYPGEGDLYTDVSVVKDGKWERKQIKTTHSDFIIDI